MSKLSLAGEWKLRGEFMDVTADRCAEVLVHLNAMPPKPTIPGYLTEENMTEEEREMYLKEPDPKFTVNTALAMHPYPSKTGYIPMTVPGDVTTALIDNGVIDEPFLKDNTKKSIWIKELSWWLVKEFDITEEMLNEDIVRLNIEMLDFNADILVNGIPAGHQENTFCAFSADIKRFLHVGTNQIVIRLTSGMELNYPHDTVSYYCASDNAICDQRVYTRKPQFTYGWDWCQPVPTCGIGRSIEIEAFSGAQVIASRVDTLSLSGNDAEIEFHFEIEKSNMLMIGPTGSGKTYLVKTLARLLDVPLAITDATSLTEAGYIGDDIESVVSKLLAAADNDVERAEHGIIFIDEIDKIAKKKNTNQRDVSGEAVQQGMLKLLEGSEVEVPVGANSKNAMVPLVTVNTRNILFICGGAFPDLENIIKERLNKQASIGFYADLKDKYDNDPHLLQKVTVEDIRSFGMIPEFIGRLPIIFTLDGLNEDMLVKILQEPKNAILKQYQKLLALDEVKLEFEDGALHAIAAKALERDTGARALRAILEEYMLDIMYEIPKDDSIGEVVITREYIEGNGGPRILLRGQEPILLEGSH